VIHGRGDEDDTSRGIVIELCDDGGERGSLISVITDTGSSTPSWSMICTPARVQDRHDAGLIGRALDELLLLSSRARRDIE
jgi:hypothetical protein